MTLFEISCADIAQQIGFFYRLVDVLTVRQELVHCHRKKFVSPFGRFGLCGQVLKIYGTDRRWSSEQELQEIRGQQGQKQRLRKAGGKQGCKKGKGRFARRTLQKALLQLEYLRLSRKAKVLHR